MDADRRDRRWSIAVSQSGAQCSLPEVSTCADLFLAGENGSDGDRGGEEGKDKSNRTIGAREKDNREIFERRAIERLQRVLDGYIDARTIFPHFLFPVRLYAQIILRKKRRVKPHEKRNLSRFSAIRAFLYWQVLTRYKYKSGRISRGGLWTVTRK